MLVFISVFHIVVAIMLIVLVLLQDSKGGAMGMLGGGGGGNTVFGSTGATSFLVTATRWIAIAFAATSITLAYMTSQKNESVLDKFAPGAGGAPIESTMEAIEKPKTENSAKDEKAEAATESK